VGIYPEQVLASVFSRSAFYPNITDGNGIAVIPEF